MSPVKLALLSLTLDLSRIAMAISRNSDKVSDRFSSEAQNWLLELQEEKLPNYVQKRILSLSDVLKSKNSYEKADDCVTYCTILSNYAKTLE